MSRTARAASVAALVAYCVFAPSMPLSAATPAARKAVQPASQQAPQQAAVAVPEDQAAPGPGRELFIAHCSSCHSMDYIRMHAPFGTRALWEASVAKMRNAFKAPVGDEDARAIVEYLSVAYGPTPPSADDRQ
jgi:mono/diheme cytochrome c family protein